MYQASGTGVVKLNLLPPDFFRQLFLVKNIDGLRELIVGNSPLFLSLIESEGVPQSSRRFIFEFLKKARTGKDFNRNLALRVIPLLYSMCTRAGGNSQIKWSVFRKVAERELAFSEPRELSKYADYSLDSRHLLLGEALFNLLNESGSKVLQELSGVLLQGERIPWARVDYRLAEPIDGKHVFAIVDVGMGSVGAFEKDVIAGMHGVESNIAGRLTEAVLHYHYQRTKALPEKVVIALDKSYFDEHGTLMRSGEDLFGLREIIRKEVGHENVFFVSYESIKANDSEVFFVSKDNKKVSLGNKDLMFVYNPNKLLSPGLDEKLERHLTVVGGKRFAAISDKSRNSPLLLASKTESGGGRVIVPERGPIIEIGGTDELQIAKQLSGVSERIPGRGVVVKLPLPIEREQGMSFPSALFFNPESEIQLGAVAKTIKKYIGGGAGLFSTEELIKPGNPPIEIRLYFGGKELKDLPEIKRRKPMPRRKEPPRNKRERRGR